MPARRVQKRAAANLQFERAAELRDRIAQHKGQPTAAAQQTPKPLSVPVADRRQRLAVQGLTSPRS